MTAVLLDTHIWIWSIFDMPDIDPAARAAIADA
jgi:PIN domain nuclease of toxin-antitoxin system